MCYTTNDLRCTKWENEDIKKEPFRLKSSLRYQAESNCCTRFCRPLPSHSAMVPFVVWECKYRIFFTNHQIYFIKRFIFSLTARNFHIIFLDSFTKFSHFSAAIFPPNFPVFFTVFYTFFLQHFSPIFTPIFAHFFAPIFSPIFTHFFFTHFLTHFSKAKNQNPTS